MRAVLPASSAIGLAFRGMFDFRAAAGPVVILLVPSHDCGCSPPSSRRRPLVRILSLQPDGLDPLSLWEERIRSL
jgi:hypothetical protein